MTPAELRDRTAAFAAAVRKFTNLIDDPLVRDDARQLARASASAAANYRAACIGRSYADFRSKLGLALEEADEAVFWLEHMQRTAPQVPAGLDPVLAEARQVVKILAASKRTSDRRAREKRANPKRQPETGTPRTAPHPDRDTEARRTRDT